MNIAMLTTWMSTCGIAEYSKNLVEEFLALGHRVFLFTNNDSLIEPWIPLHSNLYNIKVFGVKFFGEKGYFDSNEIIKAMRDFERNYGPIDVFYVQYHISFYEPKAFNSLMEGIICKKVITRHDEAVNFKHNLEIFDSVIVHNTSVIKTFDKKIKPFDTKLGHKFIPFPTIETVPLAFSFGMGRNDYDFIKEACEEIGISFNSHDAKKDGWLTEEELFYNMQQADVIILWYNDVPIEGQSAALRTAISSTRPVIVNNIGWFKDAPAFVHKAENKNELQILLDEILHLNYIRKNSYKECAKKYLEVCNEQVT